MTEKNNNTLDHVPEWEKWSKIYKEKAESESRNDIYWYRHMCIEGLLAKVTNDYN